MVVALGIGSYESFDIKLTMTLAIPRIPSSVDGDPGQWVIKGHYVMSGMLDWSESMTTCCSVQLGF